MEVLHTEAHLISLEELVVDLLHLASQTLRLLVERVLTQAVHQGGRDGLPLCCGGLVITRHIYS